MNTKVKAAIVFLAAIMVSGIVYVMAAPAADAWHGELGVKVECNSKDQSEATWTLTEPGESWNSSHADMVVKTQTGDVFAVGTKVEYNTSYSPFLVVITEPKTVTLTVGWVGSSETSSVTATAHVVKGCTPGSTTTTAAPTTTTEAPTTTTEAPTTTVAPTTTTEIPPTTTKVPPAVTVPPTEAPPTTVPQAPPVPPAVIVVPPAVVAVPPHFTG